MKKKKNSLIGLEVSSHEVRMVEVGADAGAPRVLASGSAPMPAGCIVDGVIVDTKLLATTIRGIYQAEGFKAKEVVIGLDGANVLFRTAQFLKVPEEKQKNVILLQAEEFLPVAVAETELDYIVTGETTDDAGTKIDTFLVAAKRNHIEKLIDACVEAKLQVYDVTVSLLMLATSVLGEEKQGALVLVTTDIDTVNVLFVVDGKPSFARTIAVAPQSADNKTAWQENIAREIRSSVVYYNSRNHQTLDTITLLQQEPDTSGLIEIIGQGEQLTVQEVAIFPEINWSITEKTMQGCIVIAANRLGGE